MRLSQFVPMSVVIAYAALCTSPATSASITLTAFNNATVQPAGPRTGSNGKAFFNMEGSVNGSSKATGDAHNRAYTVARSGGNNQVIAGGVIRIVIDPNDANVAATYAGATFNPATSRPELILTSGSAVPEPATIFSFALGIVVLLGFGYFRHQQPGRLRHQFPRRAGRA